MELKWDYYLWDSNHEVDMDSVESLGIELKVKFPRDYLSVVMVNQGKVPNPNKIKIGDRITSVGVLFLIDKDEEYKGSTIRSNVMLFEDDIPDAIIPIMGSGGGSVFAFDFRDSSDDPNVVFVNAEKEGLEAITLLSDSFRNFLSLLRDDLA